MGGIGKTQLAIAYARLHQACYTSVFWANATSEQMLVTSFQLLARRVLEATEVAALNREEALSRTLAWLAVVRNTRWLLIFDNYNEPTHFDIGQYCPYASHGSIIVTTRLPELVSGQLVRVQLLQNIDESLEVLQIRSQRVNVSNSESSNTPTL